MTPGQNITAAPTGHDTQPRCAALTDAQMPRDFAVSLAAYARGGSDRFLGRAPDHLPRQVMTGFDPAYVDIIDYIVRITHRIWEEKDIGYIYDSYAHDCRVWDDVGLQYGRDKIVADTVHTNAAIPDIRRSSPRCRPGARFTILASCAPTC